MSTITKQWLQQKIADMEAARDEIPFGLDEGDSNTLAALRIALASLEAEPAIHRWRRVTSEPYGPILGIMVILSASQSPLMGLRMSIFTPPRQSQPMPKP